MTRLTLSLFVLFATTSCAYCQSFPVKPGLWENIVYDDDGKPSITALACMTPTSFAEAITKVNSRPGCKLSVHDVTAHGMIVDFSCTSSAMQMTKHSVLEVVDSEHVRSTATMTITSNGKPDVSTVKASARFKTANCGDIKPNEPKITSN